MNFSFAKLLVHRLWQAVFTSRIISVSAIAFTLSALTVSTSSTVSAHSFMLRDGDKGSGNSQRATSGTLFVLSEEEQKDLPRIRLTGQIMFQVLAAEIALQRGQLAPAYQTYLALAHNTHDPRMAQRATEIALGAQSTTDALTAAHLWHQYAPHSERAIQLNAVLFVLNGQLDKARPILAAELAKIPPAHRGNAILWLQSLISRSPNQMHALYLLQALLKNDMQRAEAQFALARQQIIVGHRARASRLLQKALKLKPDFEAAALLLAQLGPAQRQKAIAAMLALVQKEPTSYNARLALAQLYLADHQLDAARQEFKALAKGNPTDLVSAMALALIEMQQKRYHSAQQYLQYYLQAASQRPNVDIGIAYLYLAQIESEQKESVQALRWLDKISRASAQYLPAQMMRAQILAKTGNVEGARQLLAALDSHNPQEQVLIALTNSSILFEARRYAQAEAELAKAYQAFPDEPNLIYDYAMAAEKNRHYDLMESLLRRLMTVQPNNPNAYNALGFSLAQRGQRLGEASKLLKKALALAPNDPFVIDSMGWLRYRLGNYQEAAGLLRRAYRLHPNAEIGAHLGEVLWEQGQQKQAQQIWRDAQKLEPDNDTLQKTLKRLRLD